MRSQTTTQVLPSSVDALKFCQQRVQVSGILPLAGLQRLATQLYIAEGNIQVELSFGVDEQSRKTVSGQLQVLLPLVCQRCLDRIDVPVSSELSLALVWNDDQAAQLPRSLDPFVMEGEELDLSAVVEEELLLALPLVAMHDAGTCEPPPIREEHSVAEPEEEQRINPFQVLAALKPEAKTTKE